MTSTATQNDDLRKLRDMIKDIDFCMLTTIDENGDLHSRPMSSNGDIEEDGDIWFFTGLSSHKVNEVSSAPQVNLSFADPDNQRYVSVTGTAELVAIDKRSKSCGARNSKYGSQKELTIGTSHY